MTKTFQIKAEQQPLDADVSNSEDPLSQIDESRTKREPVDANLKSIERIAEFYGLDYERAKEIIQFYSRALNRLMFIIENSQSERTSLMGIKLLHSIISTQPKEPLVAIQNNVGNSGFGSAEERLREAHELLRQRKALEAKKDS